MFIKPHILIFTNSHWFYKSCQLLCPYCDGRPWSIIIIRPRSIIIIPHVCPSRFLHRPVPSRHLAPVTMVKHQGDGGGTVEFSFLYFPLENKSNNCHQKSVYIYSICTSKKESNITFNVFCVHFVLLNPDFFFQSWSFGIGCKDRAHNTGLGAFLGALLGRFLLVHQ